MGEKNATIATRLTLSGAGIAQIVRYGAYLYDASGNQLTYIDEYADFENYNYLDIYYDINSELNYTLTKGTTYKYRFFVALEGKEHWSDTWSFTTKGIQITDISASKTSASIGEAITWTITATSGSGPIQYGFDLYKGSELLQEMV